ncbi:MAG TPA: polyhydroxyalkanoic acid system family protein [Polyangiaceae bacterium LLY-WYZ-15_(1-7)]|nr:hypothetical protein [Myxococcales bacterium]MAT25964.1 hypothetical protein [Sandaracinus sp.]HJK91652.1 polyhydroxyalkanoic acid system family protein [Polyangiaceae bacterium LLY-WYZ-15_(1-7)]MBJ74372.1 hypothetical protein [Sandaracinus sp.]HJL03248.1 polyhydroxyalkanoic acid system family protein [Polyangiaceae bacterium LLY-WYZ-15_(1-7)]
MKHSVEHDLDLATAKKATQKAFESYSERFEKYNPTANWSSETQCDVSFTVKGVKLDGALELKPKSIEMDLQVPLLFRPFKNKALDVVEREVRKWVEKARNGEL